MDKELKSIIDETIEEFMVKENILGKEFKVIIKGQEFSAITDPYASGFRSVAFLPDGKQVASFTHDTKEGAEMDLYKQLQTRFVSESVGKPTGEKTIVVRNPYVGEKEYKGMTPDQAMRAFHKDHGVVRGKQIVPKYTTYTLKESVDGMPPSGEEKYSKQQPGGTMGTSNTATLAVEDQKKSEREEIKTVGPRDFARFVDNMMNFVNASNVPLKVTVTEFTVMADKVHSSKSYIVRVDNG